MAYSDKLSDIKALGKWEVYYTQKTKQNNIAIALA